MLMIHNTHTTVTRSRRYGVAMTCALLCTAVPVGWATVLSDMAQQLKAGEWKVLNVAGDSSGFGPELLRSVNDNIFNYTDRALWDPISRQVRFIGSGHIAEQKFITYSEVLNAWRLEPKPFWDCTPTCLWGGVGHGYEHSTIDPTTGNLYARPFNSFNFFKYTIPATPPPNPGTSNGVWSQLPDAPGNPAVAAALAYFPEMGGLIYVGNGEVYFYSEVSKAWRRVATGLAMGPYHNVALYNPVHKLVAFGGGNGSADFYKIDMNGMITKLANAPINIGIAASVFTLDPVSGKYLVFGQNNSFYEYNPASNSWAALSAANVPFFTGNGVWFVVATPISSHGVIMVARHMGDQSKVWIYRHTLGGMSPPPLSKPMQPKNFKVE